MKKIYSLFLQCESISTDTRSIPKNSMFFALKGNNFNGNEFAEQAIRKGAKYAIVDEPQYDRPDEGIFCVNNCLETLQNLANYHRKQLKTPIISLTGSNGKTTTKELIAKVLQKKYKLIATSGNLNNHIGVPLTLLAIKNEHELAIVEMGANHLKEIEFLCNIAEPDYGYVTNFGKAHLEGFGGINGVIQAKSELYNYLEKNNKIAFVNDQDEKQIERTKNLKTIKFGTHANADYTFKYLKNRNAKCPPIQYNSTLIQSELIGEYNLSNVAAAIAIGLYFGVDLQDIKSAIEAYTSGENRSQLVNKNNYKIILDAYNANPSSMELALKNFAAIDGEKAVVLGDMFELGEASKVEHQTIADLAYELKFDEIYLIGEAFNGIQLKEHFNTKVFKTRDEAIIHWAKKPILSKNILIKGSRGMQLEKIIDFL